MAFLSAKAFHFRDGYPLNPYFREGLPDVIKLEGLDNRIDHFHLILLYVVLAGW
jgi:hypothetical protein